MKQKITSIIVFILLLSFVSAESLVIELNNNNWELEKYYYIPEIQNQFGYTGGTLFEEDIVIKIVFNDETVIETMPTEFGLAIIDNPQEIKKFEVYNQDNLLFEKEVSFCNNNNICEPCTKDNCDISENSFLCNDCSDNEKDNACNIDVDCDLDCRTYYANFDIDKYKECFEDNLELECSDHGLIFCEEGLYCDSETIDISGKNCCTGECIENVDPVFIAESCKDFGMESCTEEEFCTGEELYYVPNEITCCTDSCEEKEDKIKTDLEPDTEETPSENLQIVILVGAILILILTFLFLKNKKIISVSFIFIILFSSVLITTLLRNNYNNITGYATVETKEEQMAMAMEIAKSYGMDQALYLALLEKESSINHYREDGSVKISGDCGVGISQQQWHNDCDKLISGSVTFVCGTSEIDGRSLNAKVLRDNLECGILKLKGKYNALNCDTPREYYCANSDIPIPEKRVVYDGWDCALRGYNGWGCRSPYFENLYGKTSDKYLRIVNVIQSYVESLNDRAVKFKEGVSGEREVEPSQSESELLSKLGDNLGFYYLNPSFKIQEDFDLKSIHNEIAAAPDLIKNVLECKETGGSLSSCINSNKKDNWLLSESCSNNICKFDIDTSQKIWVYTDDGYVEQSFILKIALTFNESGIKDIPEWEDDVITSINPRDDIEPGEQTEIPPGFIYGLDISHWSGEVSKEQMQCLWDSGVKHIIAGTQKPEITKQQLMMAIDQGMIVDIYSYIYYNDFSYAGRGNQILNSLDINYRQKVGVHWIDVEQSTEGYTYEQIMKKLRQEVKTCQSQPNIECGIYTGPGPWSSITGNTKEFSDLPLWYAVWDGQKNFDSFGSQGNWWDGNFGGWEYPVGHQYKDTHHPCGVNADANVFEGKFLAQRNSVSLI